jgi:hypothetical protein
VLIVVLFAAVFILLRYYEPTDEERAIRRQASQRRREQQQSDTSSPFIYAQTSITPVTLTQKVAGFFGMGKSADDGARKAKTDGKSGRESGRGWIRASGDEWETDANGVHEVQTRSLSGLQTPKDTGEVHGIRLADRSMARDDGSLDRPFQPTYSSNSSMQDLYSPYASSSAPPPLHTAVTRLQTASSLSPSSSSLSASYAARTLSGSPEPYATGSADDLRPNNGRQFSGESISTRTSHTGTKFVESLE